MMTSLDSGSPSVAVVVLEKDLEVFDGMKERATLYSGLILLFWCLVKMVCGSMLRCIFNIDIA